MCDALVEGVRTSSREEMPLAMACFRTVFPVYVQALPEAEWAAAFERIFEVRVVYHLMMLMYFLESQEARIYPIAVSSQLTTSYSTRSTSPGQQLPQQPGRRSENVVARFQLFSWGLTLCRRVGDWPFL